MNVEALFFVAQILSIIALIISVVSFQLKRRTTLLLLNAVVCLLLATQFFMLGAVTAGIVFCVAAVRALVFYKFDKPNRPLWPLIFIVSAFLVLSVPTWNGTAIGLVPILSPVLGSIGLWQRNTQSIRKMLIIPPLLWLLHNIIIGAYGAALFEIVSLAAIFTGIWKNRKMTLERAEMAQ